MKRCLVILLLVGWRFPVTAQTQLFTLQDGLSNNDVTSILQARNGYLWIGTANGLNLYDGYTFREYNRESGLTSAKIKCLYEDAKGLLWVGTWEGLSILDPRTGVVRQHLKNRNENGLQVSYEVTAIVPTAAGVVLVGTADGTLLEFSDENTFKKIYTLKPREKVFKSEIFAMCSLADTSTVILTNYGTLVRLDKHHREVPSFSCTVENIIAMAASRNNKMLLLGTPDGDIYTVAAATGKRANSNGILSRPQILDKLTTLYLAEDATLWLGFSEGSLIAENPGDHSKRNYSNELRRFITGAPTVIYRDRKNILWIGTNYGLVKFCPKNHLFHTYLSMDGAEYRYKNSIRGMMEDIRGDVYVGSYNGLFCIGKKSDSVSHFTFNDYPRGRINAFFPYRLLDDSSYIWLTSETRGFYCFNKKTKNLEFPFNKLSFYRGYALLSENPDSLWVGTHNGLFIFSKRTASMSKFRDEGDIPIADVQVTDLVKDRAGDIWIGSYSSGIYRMNASRRVVQRFCEASTGLPLNFISVLFSESDSILWAGTRGSGLFRVNTTSGAVRVWTKKNGLADNSVAGIEKDDGGMLWISTFNGLSRFDIAANTFENYYDKDGLTDNEFNIAAHLKGRDGRMYFGGLNGVNAFYPRELRKEKLQAPKIFLTRFVKYDGTTDSLQEKAGDLAGLDDITLKHGDKFFSFYFSLDDYYAPLRNTFLYKLDGYDKAWTNIGHQNNIRFNSLPAGDYTLHVKGLSSSGLASSNILAIRLSVNRAFYTSWWFYLLLSVLAALVIVMITRYRIYQGLKIRKLRTKISSDLHDEVGSLLTRITIQAELMKQGILRSDAKEEVGKIADTSRLATAAMSDVLWSIDARNDRMGNLIDRFREHAADVLSPLEAEVDFEIRNIDAEKEIDTVSRQNLFLIFKEAIHNIAKHSSASRVKVLLDNSGREFVMSIHDNGTLKNQGTKQGQGLRNMYMRAAVMSGSLDIDQTEGYRVTLRIKKL